MAITATNYDQALEDLATAEGMPEPPEGLRNLALPTLVITTDFGVDEILYGGQLFQCENCDQVALMTLGGLLHWETDARFCQEWDDEVRAYVTSELRCEPLPFVDVAKRPF